MNEGYQRLAHAIVLHAVNDYRRTLRTLAHSPQHRYALVKKSEIEEFFRSQYYKLLTGLEGEKLIQQLQAEIKHKGGAVG